MTYSFNEAKLGMFYNRTSIVSWDNSDALIGHNSDAVIVLPLLNARVLPQFNHRQFKHPVVPMVDMKNGFTSIFSLNMIEEVELIVQSVN